MKNLFKQLLLTMSIMFEQVNNLYDYLKSKRTWPFWLLLSCLSLGQVAYALNAGDIAFVQYNADNTDDFAFVALVDIPENEAIKFTDKGWQSDNSWRTNEGIITWTAPTGGVTASTIVTIDVSPSSFSVGTVTESGALNFAATGDQIIAYQDTDTMIAALNVEGSATWQSNADDTNTSALPQGLTNGVNAVSISEIDNAKYTGTTTGTRSDLLQAINNSANWSGDDGSNQTFSGSFSIQAGCYKIAPITHCIDEVQGSGANTPISGTTVTIEAIVTGDFQDGSAGVHGDLNGFFVQEEDVDIDGNDNTSDGLFIYNGTVDIEVGDKVQIKGTASEYEGSSELSNIESIVIISKNNTLPTTTTIDLPWNSTTLNNDNELIADFEQYESMLVQFADTLTIVELYNLDRFGEFVALEGGRATQFTQTNTPNASGYDSHLLDIVTRSITVDDGYSLQSEIPIYPDGELDTSDVLRMGDTVTDLEGILYFGHATSSFGSQTYRLMPTLAPSFTNFNPRPASHSSVGGTLKVASFNVQNYFNTVGSDGADTSAELIRQTDKLLQVLINLGADIIGLQELENNYTDGSNSAIAHLVSELNARVGAGTYDYVDPSVNVGDADIAVGIMYKTASVAQTANTSIEILEDTDLAALSMSAPIFDGSGTNRAPLATTFTQTSTGETFTFVVAHMKSKFSAGSYSGDSDTGDGQGLSNETRLWGVRALKAWLETDPTSSNDDDFLVVGDFNAYAKEDPIIEMENDYTNLIGENNHSYVFDAQIGTMDYAFASSTLNTQVTGSTIWHINADEPDVFDYNENNNDSSLFDATTPYRASDHDPVVVGLMLTTSTSEDESSDNDTDNSDNSSSSSDSDTDNADNSSSSNAPPPSQPDYYLLTIGGSKAHITSQPSGIDCEYGEGICSQVFDRGEVVELELVKIKTADGFSQDDYDIQWFGDTDCQDQVVTMHDTKQCAVRVYGKQGVDYSAGSNDSDNTSDTTTGQLELLNFSGHSLLRGGSEDLILGFILEGEGTTDVTLHADVIDAGVIPKFDLNQVLLNDAGQYYGKLLNQQQQSDSFTFDKTIGAGVYTIQLSSNGLKGRGMAGISLKNNQLNLTNLSVRGYLQDVLVLNFIVGGEGTQHIQVNSRILSGDVETQLQMLNLAALESVTGVVQGSSIEVGAGAYAVLLNVLSGQGIGMIEVNLIQ